MQTMVDLPDELFWRARARAALEGLELKELIVVYVEQGLAVSPVPGDHTERQRSPLPIARPATGNMLPLLNNEEIAHLLEQEEVERVCRD